jgi:hypothetical protein
MSPSNDPFDSHGRRVAAAGADPGSAAPDGRQRQAGGGSAPLPSIAEGEAEGEWLSGAGAPDDAQPDDTNAAGASCRRLAGRGRRLARPAESPAVPLTGEQRLLVLDAWRRSGLPAGDFGPLVGLSKHTLYDWKRRFEAEGPAGLADKPRGSPRGSRSRSRRPCASGGETNRTHVFSHDGPLQCS